MKSHCIYVRSERGSNINSLQGLMSCLREYLFLFRYFTAIAYVLSFYIFYKCSFFEKSTEKLHMLYDIYYKLYICLLIYFFIYLLSTAS